MLVVLFSNAVSRVGVGVRSSLLRLEALRGKHDGKEKHPYVFCTVANVFSLSSTPCSAVCKLALVLPRESACSESSCSVACATAFVCSATRKLAAVEALVCACKLVMRRVSRDTW